MLDELFKTECIKYGKFTLKSGEISKYYFDMKGLISYPKLMKNIGDTMYKLMNELHTECDLLCGVPIPVVFLYAVIYQQLITFL